jgi:biotin carboxyl carrier protein
VREPEPVVEKKKVVVKPVAAKPSAGGDEMQDALRSPLPGTVIEILAKSGQQVKEGDTLIVLEAMKMNNNLTAEKDGVVKSILVAEGEAVKENTPLVTFE